MGYNATWHVEKRVIYLRLFDAVSADELRECNHATMQLVREGTQPIHVIIDALAIVSYPTNLRWVVHMIQHNPSKAVGWRIIVANDHTIRVLLSAILGVLHVPIHTCDTPQQAHDFLKEVELSSQALAR